MIYEPGTCLDCWRSDVWVDDARLCCEPCWQLNLQQLHARAGTAGVIGA